MKKSVFCTVIILMFAGVITGSGKETGKIGGIDAGKKEIIVNVRSRENLKIGDLLEVQAPGGKIVLEVIFPMQTVARCKIKGKGKLSELSKGMVVYRYSSEVFVALKTGDTRKIGDMEFVYVEGGTYIMGSPLTEADRRDDEAQHEVTVYSFWMGKYEVTQKQFTGVMGVNPSSFKGENLPVEKVKLESAIDFCKKFSSNNDVKARLPYEAEWEYACRAGTATKYYWGDSVDGAYCWYPLNSDEKTHPVGTRKPNAWGFYDMSGNIYEWCTDGYEPDYYKDGKSFNPSDYLDLHVQRGGSWNFGSAYMRSAARGKMLPSMTNYNTGFRVVVEP